MTADNTNKKDVTDAAVFGFVFDEDNTSVVANNPDGASDAGQVSGGCFSFSFSDRMRVSSF